MIINRIGAGRLFLIGILMAGCTSKRNETGSISYSPETARLVSHVTSDVIRAGDDIRVRFVSPVVPGNRVGKSPEKDVFTFVPGINGAAGWEDRRTLLFRPDAPLPFRQNYRGAVDLAALFPQHRNLQPLEFAFHVAGREIVSLDADFELIEKEDPRRVVYKGQVTFSEKTLLEQVRQAGRLSLGRKRLSLVWKADAEGSTFAFVSDPIVRGAIRRELRFDLDKEPLEISRNYVNKRTLAPVTEMKVVKVEGRAEGREPGLAIEMTDDPDPGQDLRGLIAVEPALDIRISAAGRGIHVSGDFEHGRHYTLTIHPGIRSRWGAATASEHTETVEIPDLKPRIRFSEDGMILPTINRQRVRFRTVNVSQARLRIKQVFDSNLGQFLQSQSLKSGVDRRRDFQSWAVNRVGVGLVDTVLEIGQVRNRWLQHELDLNALLDPSEKGPLLIGLSFKHVDMLYGAPGEAEEARKQWRWNRGLWDYRSHPFSPGYINTHGRVFKPVIVSDIGLTYKKARRRHLVYVRNLNNAAPMSGVTVTLRTFQNQVVGRGLTDRHGAASFPGGERDVFYVEAEKDGQKSIIKCNEMAWDLSTFDTGGVSAPPDGVRAYIYSERGVYRPGDEIHLSLIARNSDETFPENHPVTLKLFNPRNQLVLERTSRTGKDGFYAFSFRTEPDDPTGNWRARLEVGSRTFDHTVKVETVVPYRLKVRIEPEKTRLTPEDEELRLVLASTYLFGNPAVGLDAEVAVEFAHAARQFANYPGFSFTNEAVRYKTSRTSIFKGKLDAEGRARVRWPLSVSGTEPSGVRVRIEATVLEKGGRPNRSRETLDLDPYERYVGVRKPRLDYGYARLGSSLEIPVVLVTTHGEAMPGLPLEYRIYRSTSHWWWEYQSRDQFRLKFKTDQFTQQIESGSLFSQVAPVPLVFTPEERGEYLIEVKDGSGHTAAFFMRAYPWGEAQADPKSAGMLALRTDRKAYAPGDSALVKFPAPRQGAILVSVEQDSRILQTRWYEPDGRPDEFQVPVPITRDMAPTAYVGVSVLQPYAQTMNDRPIRIYGVVPLNVSDPHTRQEIALRMPGELTPESAFQIQVETGDGEPAQFTLAVVDEGLLALTGFSTPDAWQSFYRKRRLGVVTHDVYSHVIGANRGDVFKTFAVGGGFAYRASQLEPERAKRFKAVSLFKGPIETDADGRATVDFEMPDYTGSVRVMAVSASGGRYGKAESSVPVKTDLMVMPTLPRVLGPGDRITVPVTVFAMVDSIGPTEVSIHAEGPVSVVGTSRQELDFSTSGEQELSFTLQAASAVGQARVVVAAEAPDIVADHETDLNVRPSSPRTYAAQEQEIRPGERVRFTVPDKGLPGTNRARVVLRRHPEFGMTHRLLRLVRFPYGCIEQTVSTAFPLLYLSTFLEGVKYAGDATVQIDTFINSAIRKLRKFKLGSGGFAYWPGANTVSTWGSLYAGHFLIEAAKLGYHVPQDLMANWMRYEKSRSLTVKDGLMARVYRVYLLALAGEYQIGPMNLLKETGIKDMNDTQKWLLAAAYHLAGVERTAAQILIPAGKRVEVYNESGGTYGSGMRDLAIILNTLVMLERWSEADEVANDLGLALASQKWYSTQTTGFMLLSLGKYVRSLDRGEDGPSVLTGTIRLPDGREMPFETDRSAYHVEIEEGFGREVAVTLDSASTVRRAFATLDWDGVPLTDDEGDTSSKLALKVRWLNDDGLPVDPAELSQGENFWGHLRVRNLTVARNVEELALVQVLPAGWEIDNPRLSARTAPGWTNRLNLNREEYMDARDDRVMWFFDFKGRRDLDFVVRLSAVTAGSFRLPATVAEAMYDRSYRATAAGKRVVVKQR
ncbi:MAG: MG2 domain-containing protein [Gemmatimonadetes bacterium]|nr:MG2 domain-containing protein [Gemmatimonadota bacterium]